MELTETERMMLIKKKEKICKLTLQILGISHDQERILEIKKDFTAIVSLLTQIACYSNTKQDIDELPKTLSLLFGYMDKEKLGKCWVVSPIAIEVVCNLINAVRFDFSKRGLKIILPKNLNIGSIVNK